MAYKQLMYWHMATVLPCVVIGAMLLLLKKGKGFHKYFGIIYMILMFATALITLFMPAFVGPRLFNHFGWIHSFSVLTIYSVPTAYRAIKKGNVKKHKSTMINLYFGAIIIAGAFTLVPGRYLHHFLFGG